MVLNKTRNLLFKIFCNKHVMAKTISNVYSYNKIPRKCLFS